MRGLYFLLFVFVLMSCQSKNSWECEGDCMNGKGTKIWKDGGIEKGTWKNGKLVGKGYQFFGKTSKFAGDTYEGEFLNSYHGFGVYTDVSEGATYVGEWRFGKFHGKGKLSLGPESEFPNRYYEGEWRNGKRHGYGVKFWGESGEFTNDKYQGEWENDNMHGYGRYDWNDGSYYVGEWRNDEQHGKGVYTFPDGEKLEGEWREGYNRELAIKLYGENAASFSSLIDEVDRIHRESCQGFIDEMTFVYMQIRNEGELDIDFKKLTGLLNTVQDNHNQVFLKLEEVSEYDEEITYKEDYKNYVYAFDSAFNRYHTWFALMQEGKELEAEELTFEIIEILKHAKEQEERFKKTEERFNKKYEL